VDELYSGASGSERQATATLGIRVIETETSRVGFARSETASASEGAGSEFSYSGNDLSRVERRAISDAASRLCHAIRANLGREISSVVKADGNNFYIDVGSGTGSRVGALYLVYAEGETVYDRNRNPIGRERFPVAVVRVSQVQERLSACVQYGGYVGKIRAGDIVEPISEARVRDLVFSLPQSRGQSVVEQVQRPVQPVPDPPKYEAQPPRYGNPFLGTWTAVDGNVRYKNGKSNLTLKSGEMRIRALPNGNIGITSDFRFENNTGGYQYGSDSHEVKASVFEGKLPKKIRWKKTKEMTTNKTIKFQQAFIFSIEFKNSNTILFLAHDDEADRYVTFKLK
jgi:hypothetical protein